MRNIGTLLVATTFALACSSGSGAGKTPISTGGSGGTADDANGQGGARPTGGNSSSGGVTAAGGTSGPGGATGGTSAAGDVSGSGGTALTDAAVPDSRLPADTADDKPLQPKLDGTGDTAELGGSGGAVGSGGTTSSGGTGGKTADSGAGGTTGGVTGTGGSIGGGGSAGTTGCTGAAGSGPVGTISGDLATGIKFMDTDGKPVNAHGGGIIQVCDTFYMHGEYFLSTTTDNNFNGFSMYSSKNLATWKNEGIILPQQASGELGPNRKGERPHIIQCPKTDEFVLYAHAASSDYQTDKEVVYATSATVNGQYSYKGPLKNASGQTASHSDMSAYADETGAYVITESGVVYTLATDCHSWLTSKSVAVNCTSGGSESPTVFKAGGTYYWIGSNKTGWRANNNFYSTASSMTGTWTCQGFIAPVTDSSNEISDERTWLSQSTWVQPIVGSKGTTYVYWGDHWYGTTDTSNPGKHNDQATYVFQPLVFSSSTKMLLPTYLTTWTLDVGAGTWSQ
jgi:hypothetical protein